MGRLTTFLSTLILFTTSVKSQNLRLEKTIYEFDSSNTLQSIFLIHKIKIDTDTTILISKNSFNNFQSKGYYNLTDINYYSTREYILTTAEKVSYLSPTLCQREKWKKLKIKKGETIRTGTFAYFKVSSDSTLFGAMIDDKLIKRVIVKVYPKLNDGLKPLEYDIDIEKYKIK